MNAVQYDNNVEEYARIDDLVCTLDENATGCLQASRQVDDPQLSHWCRTVGLERKAMVDEMRNLLWMDGHEPSERTAWESHVHRCWSRLRGWFLASDPSWLMNEIENADERLSGEFDRTMANLSSQYHRLVLRRLRQAIRRQTEHLHSINAGMVQGGLN